MELDNAPMRAVQVTEWAWADDHPFKNKLDKTWGISKDTYQILDAILRQAIVCPDFMGYEYAFDERIPQLTLKGSTPSAYIGQLGQYVADYDAKKKLRFESLLKLHKLCRKEDSWNHYSQQCTDLMKAIGADGADSPVFLLRTIDDRSRYIDPSLMLEYGFERMVFRKGFDDGLTYQGWKIEMEKRPPDDDFEEQLKELKDELAVFGRMPGKFIEAGNKLEGVKLCPLRHDFFKHYFASAHAVFYPLFVREKGDLGHRFYKFLSLKISDAFSVDNTIDKNLYPAQRIFDAETLSDRIRKNKKFADQISEKLQTLGLISDEFFDTLDDENEKSLSLNASRSVAAKSPSSFN